MISSHLFPLMLKCFLAAASVGTLKEVSGRARNDGFFRDRDQDMVSQHMSKLYERYNREHRLKEGNTVRSFRADQDSSDHRTVYRLNLTTLQDTEVILSATFHFLLDGRPHHKSWSCKRFKSALCRSSVVHASPSISLILRSISSGSGVSSGPVGSLLGNLTFHPQRRGVWQMKDVTQVIKEARNKGHRLVLVELDLMQQYQKKREETLSARSLPYLLLYANDQALAEPNSVAASLQRYDPFSERGEPSQSSQLLHQDDSLPDLNGRVRREATLLSDPIENNELPEVDYRPEGYRKDDLWESTWYLALKLKPKTEKKENKRTSQDEDMKLSRRTEDKKERVVLKEGEGASQQPKPQHSTVTFSDGQKHEGKDEGKDGNKHKGDTNSQSPVLSFDEQTMRKARRRQWSDNQHRGCSRRNLRVDFADIGWSEWVIAPKAFDAFYCAGTCGFPMPKVARPSNHATIQSIVRAVGIVPGIPEPCCVPEKMNPLAVLYQDESRNPVLKVYPNMSVQSCSCR